jgi:hypothetical protein
VTVVVGRPRRVKVDQALLDLCRGIHSYAPLDTLWCREARIRLRYGLLKKAPEA